MQMTLNAYHTKYNLFLIAWLFYTRGYFILGYFILVIFRRGYLYTVVRPIAEVDADSVGVFCMFHRGVVSYWLKLNVRKRANFKRCVASPYRAHTIRWTLRLLHFFLNTLTILRVFHFPYDD